MLSCRDFCGLAAWMLLAPVLLAQTVQAPDKPADRSQGGTIDAKQSSQSGFDRPAILIPADSAEVTTRILLRGLDSTPVEGDLDTGLLVSTQRPDFLVRPHLTLLGAPAQGRTGEFLTPLKIEGLVAFGESTVPLLYKGRQVESLRFSKPGLVAKPPTGDAFVMYEGQSSLLIVLENPSTFAYNSVRARLRFVDQDVCLFTPEKFVEKGEGTSKTGVKQQSCETNGAWTEFEIPQFAQVSLRAIPSTSWFFDPNSKLARSAKRKGWLTLRFKDKDPASSQIQEQNLPIEFQFEPSDFSLFRSLLYVFVVLLLGALLSLLLRVSVPNIKRRSQLKDQLNEAGKVISTISTEVDSNLRVLLRVERRALDELRTAIWSFGPGYAEYAARVEQELPRLKRRIEAVTQLDAALIRTKMLYAQGVAPTRLEQIEDMLSAASETLKQDQLSDEDWVFVNQRLEGAQKLLREPTQTEKEAFEAMLSGRWKFIRKHFGDANGVLKVPEELKGMEDCFPNPSLLPSVDDKDGTEWLNSVGVVRADLQLSALSLVWEFQFLAPATSASQDQKWTDAKKTLNRLLSTPAIDNLREAKRLLRQLAEGVSEQDIVKALQNGGAMIVMDPSIARPDRTIRFSVRFRQPNLNSSAARQIVSCHWVFTDSSLRRFSRIRGALVRIRGEASEGLQLPEEGWSVHHYFEKYVITSAISVSFHDSNGVPINLSSGANWSTLSVKPVPDRRGREKWQRFSLEITQLVAALLVPLATLASTTVTGGSGTHLWELFAIGFGSDTIKNILVGKNEPQSASQGSAK